MTRQNCFPLPSGRFLLLLLPLLLALGSRAQTYVFAELTGSPLNTSAWNLQGGAYVGNVTSTGNTEVILTSAATTQSGALFFNQAINLSQCTKWSVEFDFRMNGGTMADGMAFCFLDVPPVGFVNGGGLGIPVSANGLKVCFDTYNNCGGDAAMPKIELRWGIGYNECSALPTVNNNGGTLSFIRSASYNHAKIFYDNGVINVYVNNTLYLTGNQTFNFTGYFGFTASTGALTDVHSIKNVVIYTNTPQAEAGPPSVTTCSGIPIQIGSPALANQSYSWSPATGLNDATLADPTVTLTNSGSSPITQKYYLNTGFSDGTGCTSRDSITVTILPAPSISINSSGNNVCNGTTINFDASTTNTGGTPVYQWKKNGIVIPGATASTYSSNSFADGDVVTCELVTTSCGTKTSNSITVTIQPLLTPQVSISTSTTTICINSNATFTATSTTPSISNYQWKKNGVNTGTNAASFSTSTLADGDVISCEITSTAGCLATPTGISNTITMQVQTPPALSLGADKGFCPGGSVNLDAGTAFATYLWNTGATSTTITVSAAGSYSVIGYTALGCAAYDTLVVTAWAAPVVTLPAPAPLCTGSSRSLDAGSFNAYSWNTGATTQSITVNTAGNYSVTVTDPRGCTGTGTTAVTALLPLPSNFLPADTAICSYGTLKLQPLSNYSSYLWSSNATTPSIIITTPGSYWLQVKDNNNCQGSDTVLVLPKECMKGFYIPSAFTPNGDGRNDSFRPVLFGNVLSYRFTIYNRWGNVIFSTTQLNKGWDGTIGGKKQSTETFIWSCSFHIEGDVERVEKGTVVLIR